MRDGEVQFSKILFDLFAPPPPKQKIAYKTSPIFPRTQSVSAGDPRSLEYLILNHFERRTFTIAPLTLPARPCAEVQSCTSGGQMSFHRPL
jgi:hypothetical protein